MEVFLALVLLVAGCFTLDFEENDGVHLHEGDIVLTPLQKASLEFYGDPTVSHRLTRGLTSDPTRLWSSLVVPYTVSSELQNIPVAMDAIKAGIREWEERSCLKFIPRTKERDYLNIFKGSGCWSYVGRQGGRQNLSLASGCWSVGTVAHEIAHAMGIWHEQSRPDRDNFVDIIWNNIPEKKRHNFRKYNRTQVDSLGVKYDFLSVMHYSGTAFSSNGQPTIVAKKYSSLLQLGQRVGLAPSDITQIDLLYKCNGKTTLPPTILLPFVYDGKDWCNFDKPLDLCGFHNEKNDDFDWTQRLGKTPSGSTGPVADHTTKRWGYFMYIETSSPRVSGDRAVLRKTYTQKQENGRCFYFYYHMYGDQIGKLTVDIETKQGKSLLPQPWKKSGNQGDKWLRAAIEIPPTSSSYTITFTGERGDGYRGDIAIDDIYFKDGKCSEKPGP